MNEVKRYDILIAGVGGQGTVLASRLLAEAAIASGRFVRTAETIGMSQRGGCVVSHVRIGAENCASVIPLGKADLLIAFEVGEAARSLPRLAKGAKCLVNTQAVKPVSASLSGGSYDVAGLTDYISNEVPGAAFVDGYRLAYEAGSVKAINVVLLGAATALGFLPFSKELMEKVIADNVPQKFRELNIKAFNAGYEGVECKA